MPVDFKNIKKDRAKKRKLMLWIESEICDEIDSLKPKSITTQEAIRQIIKYHLNEQRLLGLL